MESNDTQRKIVVLSDLDFEPPSMYWDGSEDESGYKEDGCPNLFND